MVYKSLREMAADIERRGQAKRDAKRYREMIQDNIGIVKRMQRERLGSARTYPVLEKISRLGDKAISSYRQVGDSDRASEILAMTRPYKVELIRAKAKGLYHSRPGLEIKIKPMAVLSILALLGALFFVSFNLTGAAIGDLTDDNFSLIGSALFFLGLIFAFIFLKKKK